MKQKGFEDHRLLITDYLFKLPKRAIRKERWVNSLPEKKDLKFFSWRELPRVYWDELCHRHQDYPVCDESLFPMIFLDKADKRTSFFALCKGKILAWNISSPLENKNGLLFESFFIDPSIRLNPLTLKLLTKSFQAQRFFYKEKLYVYAKISQCNESDTTYMEKYLHIFNLIKTFNILTYKQLL